MGTEIQGVGASADADRAGGHDGPEPAAQSQPKALIPSADDPTRLLEEVMCNPIARTALDEDLYSRILRVTASCGRAPLPTGDGTRCVRCGEPVHETLDGDPLCWAHCNEWAKGEGLALRDAGEGES